MRTGTAAQPVRPAARLAPPVPGSRRVRHELRDSLAVMAFSAGASAVLALVLTVLLPGAGK